MKLLTQAAPSAAQLVAQLCDAVHERPVQHGPHPFGPQACPCGTHGWQPIGVHISPCAQQRWKPASQVVPELQTHPSEEHVSSNRQQPVGSAAHGLPIGHTFPPLPLPLLLWPLLDPPSF